MIAMAIQKITTTPGKSVLSLICLSEFDRRAGFRYGPDRDDLCTELRRHYWALAFSPRPEDPQQFLHLKQQIKAAYYRWMSVQTQLFSGKTFDPNR